MPNELKDSYMVRALSAERDLRELKQKSAERNNAFNANVADLTKELEEAKTTIATAKNVIRFLVFVSLVAIGLFLAQGIVCN